MENVREFIESFEMKTVNQLMDRLLLCDTPKKKIDICDIILSEMSFLQWDGEDAPDIPEGFDWDDFVISVKDFCIG